MRHVWHQVNPLMALTPSMPHTIEPVPFSSKALLTLTSSGRVLDCGNGLRIKCCVLVLLTLTFFLPLCGKDQRQVICC
jgi:hypothetical protein